MKGEKMKKIISTLLVVILICSFFVFPANAIEIESEYAGTITDIEYLDNGDYIIEYLDDGVIIIPGDATTTTVTKTKTKNYYNSAGNVMWQIKVQGTFTYNGSTSTCTSAAHQATAYGSTWTIASASHSKSGNKATATATAVHHTGTGNYSYTRSVTLKCSATGVFS